MQTYHITHPSGILQGDIVLDGSKSISNRVLIIKALCENEFEVTNLSTSDDTSILQKLLQTEDYTTYDVHHAGTSFRFLTAYLSFKKGTQILTGSSRMKERPIGPLVEALNSIGAEIEYLDKQGYPPLRIGSPKKTIGKELRINAGISSQYLTALILIAPTLPNGLTIHLEGDMVSESYLKLTLGIIEYFGIRYEFSPGKIVIPQQPYLARSFKVEADWSACSYFFALTTLSRQAHLKIHGLQPVSLQGDAALMDLGKLIGVDCRFVNDVLHLKKSVATQTGGWYYDFINVPDIAQTLAVACAAKGLDAQFTGLKTLRIKETDRIAALDTELHKVGGGFSLLGLTESGEEIYTPRSIQIKAGRIPVFDTYNDHRMAMSFAPLALHFPIRINYPGVVSKSYPRFWFDMEKLGFSIHSVSE